MKIFPAIDLRDGKVVRLTQGDYDRMTVYADDPVAVAEGFRTAGATCLHMVDLDGAASGKPENGAAIEALAKIEGLFTQVGGGIRSEEQIKRYLSLGINRVILGTIATQDLAFTEAMAARYGAHIAVGVDAKDGFVAINGWKEATTIPSIDFCYRLRDAGVQTVIYTDIAKDGGLTGTNLEVYRQLRAVTGLQIIASGGISYEEELVALAENGTYGAILGKALYAGRLDLGKVIAMVAALEGEDAK